MLDSQLTQVVQAIGADIKSLNSAVSSKASVLDSATAGDTTHAWSADKTYAELAAMEVRLLGGVEGSALIGGYAVQASSLQMGDLLVFNGTKWINENETLVADGGNF